MNALNPVGGRPPRARPTTFNPAPNASLESLCEEYGETPYVVRRWAAEVGFVFQRTDKRIVYREAVADMKPIDAVAFLLDVIEQIDPDDSSEEIAKIRSHGFTAREAVIIRLMGQAFIKKRDVMARLSVGRDLDVTQSTLSRHINSIRTKFRALGWDVAIATDRDLGWHVRRAAGFLFPWEAR